jgi:hypothetical protein
MTGREPADVRWASGHRRHRSTLLAYVLARCAWFRLAARGALSPPQATSGRTVSLSSQPGRPGADRSCAITSTRRSVGPVSGPRRPRSRRGR